MLIFTCVIFMLHNGGLVEMDSECTHVYVFVLFNPACALIDSVRIGGLVQPDNQAPPVPLTEPASNTPVFTLDPSQCDQTVIT